MLVLQDDPGGTFMKRDLDLIREILLAIEDFEPETLSSLQGISPRDFSGTLPQNLHHITMLIDAGYIDKVTEDLEPTFVVRGMTMAGHDFLDAIRDKTVWEQTKTRLGQAGGWTLDIVLAVAKEELKRRLGLSAQDL